MEQLVSDDHQSHLGNRMLAYDGGINVYTAGELPFSSKNFVVRIDRQYWVQIKYDSKHSFSIEEYKIGKEHGTLRHILDVAMKATLSTTSVVDGRCFYRGGVEDGKVCPGVVYWTGCYQNLERCQMGLSMNLDVSIKPFYEPILVSDYVQNFVPDINRKLSSEEFNKIEEDLKGLRVKFEHVIYTISGLSSQPIRPIRQLMFGPRGGGKSKIPLQYSKIPAIICRSKSNLSHLPMEGCTIVEGQSYKKLNGTQAKGLLKAGRRPPLERQRKIERMVERIDSINESVANEFGLQLRTEFTAIKARVLTPPVLRYHESGRESLVHPTNGEWDMTNKKMINPGSVEYWTCINFSQSITPDMADTFCIKLIGMCQSKGMDFSEQPLVGIRTAGTDCPRLIEKAVVDIHKECTARIARMKMSGHLQLLIVILPDASGSSYGMIKRICETELGIVSQCFRSAQVTRSDEECLQNVALKINVKVGGRNWYLEGAVPLLDDDNPTIIFGADVTHPQPTDNFTSSIAAVVASMDWPQVSTYNAVLSVQKGNQEIISGLYGMTRELLKKFIRSTKLKPERIIFYRDGVSARQFNQVLSEEMEAIRKACKSLYTDYLPTVTFVVVQKRHHTRLFPMNPSTAHKSGNILPGTVVDTNICHPTEFDFYLCSHAADQGTSRPIHYHVLCDENNVTADELQNLTNCLCYTYAPCTKAVSIVAPVYYAHMAASRGRCYIEGSNRLPDIKDKCCRNNFHSCRMRWEKALSYHQLQ